MSRCRGCGATIRWVVSAANSRPQPIDPDPGPDGTLRLVEEGGDVVAHVVLPIERASGEQFYTAHHATCPQAAAFRAGAPQKAAARVRERNDLPATPARPTCVAPGCGEAVEAGHLLCWPHYRRLPRELRSRLYTSGAAPGPSLRSDLEAFFGRPDAPGAA